MQISSIAYLNKERNLFLDFKKDDDQEIVINQNNLRSIVIIFVITPHFQEFSHIRSERVIVRIKKEDVKFINNHFAFSIELYELRNPDLCQITVKVLKFSLISGDKFEVSIHQNYSLFEIQSEEQESHFLESLFKYKESAIPTKIVQKENSPYPIETKNKDLQKGLKSKIRYEVFNYGSNTPFFKFKDIKLIPNLEDIIKNGEIAEALNSLKDKDLEATELDLQELILNCIFSILKILYEFKTVKKLNIQDLLSQLIKKFFNDYLKGEI